MSQSIFKTGYLAGWQSIRGAVPAPALRVYGATPGVAPYQAGVAQGVRDANAATKAGLSIEAWVNAALRRSFK